MATSGAKGEVFDITDMRDPVLTDLQQAALAAGGDDAGPDLAPHIHDVGRLQLHLKRHPQLRRAEQRGVRSQQVSAGCTKRQGRRASPPPQTNKNTNNAPAAPRLLVLLSTRSTAAHPP